MKMVPTKHWVEPDLLFWWDLFDWPVSFCSRSFLNFTVVLTQEISKNLFMWTEELEGCVQQGLKRNWLHKFCDDRAMVSANKMKGHQYVLVWSTWFINMKTSLAEGSWRKFSLRLFGLSVNSVLDPLSKVHFDQKWEKVGNRFWGFVKCSTHSPYESGHSSSPPEEKNTGHWHLVRSHCHLFGVQRCQQQTHEVADLFPLNGVLCTNGLLNAIKQCEISDLKIVPINIIRFKHGTHWMKDRQWLTGKYLFGEVALGTCITLR